MSLVARLQLIETVEHFQTKNARRLAMHQLQLEPQTESSQVDIKVRSNLKTYGDLVLHRVGSHPAECIWLNFGESPTLYT